MYLCLLKEKRVDFLLDTLQMINVKDIMTDYVRVDFIQSRNEDFDLKIQMRIRQNSKYIIEFG